MASPRDADRGANGEKGIVVKSIIIIINIDHHCHNSNHHHHDNCQWALEYGMPSTHAMVGLAVPAASIFFTINR